MSSRDISYLTQTRTRRPKWSERVGEVYSLITYGIENGNFRYNQQVEETTVNTTSITTAPQDLYPGYRALRERRKKKRIETHGTTEDHEVHHALSYIPQLMTGNRALTYQVWGFYTIWATLFSLYPEENGLSFLTACRKVGLKMDVDELPDSRIFRDKLKEALKLRKGLTLNGEGLVLKAEYESIVDEFFNTGKFTFRGETNSFDFGWNSNREYWEKTEGLFTRMATKVCQLDITKPVQASYCVSLALALKSRLEKFANIEDAMKYLQSVLEDIEQIKALIAEGDEIKSARLDKKSEEELKSLPYFDESKEHGLSYAGKLHYVRQLKDFPPHLLRGALNLDNMFNYIEAGTIGEGGMPHGDEKGRLNGTTEEDCKNSRGARGARLPSYKEIFVARGHLDGREYTPEQLRVRNNQTLAHECLHEFLHDQMVQRNPELVRRINDILMEAGNLAKNLSPDLRQSLRNTTSFTMQYQNLDIMFDTGSVFFSNYKIPKMKNETTKQKEDREAKTFAMRSEEILANVCGLAYTEFKDSNLFWGNEATPLQSLTQKMDVLLKDIDKQIIAEKEKASEPVLKAGMVAATLARA